MYFFRNTKTKRKIKREGNRENEEERERKGGTYYSHIFTFFIHSFPSFRRKSCSALAIDHKMQVSAKKRRIDRILN